MLGCAEADDAIERRTKHSRSLVIFLDTHTHTHTSYTQVHTHTPRYNKLPFVHYTMDKLKNMDKSHPVHMSCHHWLTRDLHLPSSKCMRSDRFLS